MPRVDPSPRPAARLAEPAVVARLTAVAGLPECCAGTDGGSRTPDRHPERPLLPRRPPRGSTCWRRPAAASLLQAPRSGRPAGKPDRSWAGFERRWTCPLETNSAPIRELQEYLQVL